VAGANGSRKLRSGLFGKECRCAAQSGNRDHLIYYEPSRLNKSSADRLGPKRWLRLPLTRSTFVVSRELAQRKAFAIAGETRQNGEFLFASVAKP
jgi:hypothetical protein